jgi:hypothetical protein
MAAIVFRHLATEQHRKAIKRALVSIPHSDVDQDLTRRYSRARRVDNGGGQPESWCTIICIGSSPERHVILCQYRFATVSVSAGDKYTSLSIELWFLLPLSVLFDALIILLGDDELERRMLT